LENYLKIICVSGRIDMILAEIKATQIQPGSSLNKTKNPLQFTVSLQHHSSTSKSCFEATSNVKCLLSPLQYLITHLHHLWTILLKYDDMCPIHFTEMATALIRLIWASHYNYQPTTFTLCTNYTIVLHILAPGMGWILCCSHGYWLVVKLGNKQMCLEAMTLFGGCPLPVTWLIQWTMTYY